MTAIISWFNQEPGTIPYLMTVGDTKISNQQETLTLEGAKILELPIKCKDISSPLQEIYFSNTLGYSFAGSTLVGLNVYCYLQTIFSNLGGTAKEGNLPDYKSICHKAKEVLNLYAASIRNVAELLIFGFCPKTCTPFICTIQPVMKDGQIEYKVEFIDSFDSNIQVVIIGDKEQEIRELISKELEIQTNKDSIDYWRTPARILRDIIEQGKFDSIGGNLQIATSNIFKYDTLAVSVELKGQHNKSTLKFRNIDFFEEIYKPVGECYVAINGLVIDPQRFSS